MSNPFIRSIGAEATLHMYAIPDLLASRYTCPNVQLLQQASYAQSSPTCSSILLQILNIASRLKSVQKGGRRPRLRPARVMAVRPVLIRQFGDTRPRVVLDMLADRQERVVQVMQSHSDILRRGEQDA